MTPPPTWTVNEPSRGLLRSLRFTEVWAGRDLAVLFAARDLKVRYRQTLFGVVWALLQPLAGATALVLVFGSLAEVSTGEVPHLPFAIVGFAAWSYFAAAAGGVSQSLVSHSELVTKVYFPRLLLPVGALLPGLVDLAIGLVLAVAVALSSGVVPDAAIVTLPVWVTLLVAASAGVGLVFCSLNVRFRDVRYVFPMLVQLLFFLTPIAYPADLVSGRWLYVYGLNPFAVVVSGLRWALLGPAEGPQAWWSMSLLTTVVLFALGLWLFQLGERRFADII